MRICSWAPTPAENVLLRFTLLGTAKLNVLDPELYLRHVLERVADHLINRRRRTGSIGTYRLLALMVLFAAAMGLVAGDRAHRANRRSPNRVAAQLL